MQRTRIMSAAMVAACVALVVAPCAAQDNRPLGPVPTGERTLTGAPSTSSGSGMARTAGSLGAVLAIIFVGAACYRKFASKHQGLAGAIGAGGKSPAGIIEIVGRYPLSRGSSLVLLRLDRRILLLSQTQGASGRGMLRAGAASLTTLCEVREAEDVASILSKAQDAAGDSMSAKFQSLLSTFAKDESPAAEDVSEEDEKPGAGSPAVVVRAGAWGSGVGGVGGAA